MRKIGFLSISWDVGEGQRGTLRTRGREIGRGSGENPCK
jgi:hypothetical protein